MTLPDPRLPIDAAGAPPGAAELYRLAQRSLEADTGQEAGECDAAVVASLDRLLGSSEGDALTALFAHAPTVAIHRHLWRLLAQRASCGLDAQAALSVRLFAIPLVIVAGVSGSSDARALLPGMLPDATALAGILREHGALSGNRTLALANVLAAADAIDVARLPALMLAARDAARGDAAAPLDIAPAPLEVRAGEAAHVRFLVGSALAAPGVDLFVARDTGRWGMPLARALVAQLAAPGVSLVALPRPARSLPAALAEGRGAQREVAAQLFASNALRQLRANVGEPVAVISAHRAADAPGGGELRLSLSSPLSPRDAQGFRCPLFPGERVGDAATMLTDLLRDCRLADVRVLSGVHADRDPVTGAPLMFKPETIPPSAHVVVH